MVRQSPNIPTSRPETLERHLLGPRHLQDLLDHVASLGTQHPSADRTTLAERWRAALRIYEKLAQSEAGIADGPAIRALPKAMGRHIERLVALPGVQRTFDTVPVAFGMVELDKLVISQYDMTQAVVDRIINANARPLSPQRLAELCLPLKPPPANFHLASQRDDEFTFIADAHDMRFLDARVVPAASLQLDHVMGHPQAVVALSVGFSANLLNVVRYNDRLVLNNGHHRAHALRQMGLTHAPCLIQPCASMDDLQQAATSEICDNADLYFSAPRPPLLRDFDNPLLTLEVPSPSLRRVVTVTVDVKRRLMAL